MKKVLIDCDNTLGVEGCDVDDGLAIMYLMGRPDVEIVGITCVYGNSDLDAVYAGTLRLMRDLGMDDIPVIRGCRNAKDRGGEAAGFIAEAARSGKGDLSVLAIGPLTNLLAAHRVDNELFDNIDEIAIMGGTTGPLMLNGKELKELNLSCDPEATLDVLSKGRNVSIVTGNACLDAFFRLDDFRRRLGRSARPMARYIMDRCGYWFEDMARTYGLNGTYMWDVVAAVRLMEPSLFRDAKRAFRPAMEELGSGSLASPGDARSPLCTVNLPRIRDTSAFLDEVYGRWCD